MSPIRVRAATMPLAFAAAARATTACDPDAVEEREVREVRAHGATPEALFAQSINECLYVHEVEGFAWRRIEFAFFDAEPRAGAESMRLHPFLHGDSLEKGQPAGPWCAPVDLGQSRVPHRSRRWDRRSISSRVRDRVARTTHRGFAAVSFWRRNATG